MMWCWGSLPSEGLATDQVVWLRQVGEGHGDLPRGLGPRGWTVQLGSWSLTSWFFLCSLRKPPRFWGMSVFGDRGGSDAGAACLQEACPCCWSGLGRGLRGWPLTFGSALCSHSLSGVSFSLNVSNLSLVKPCLVSHYLDAVYFFSHLKIGLVQHRAMIYSNLWNSYKYLQLLLHTGRKTSSSMTGGQWQRSVC